MRKKVTRAIEKIRDSTVFLPEFEIERSSRQAIVLIITQLESRRRVPRMNRIDNFLVMDPGNRGIVQMRNTAAQMKPESRALGQHFFNQLPLDYTIRINTQTCQAQGDKMWHLLHERNKRIFHWSIIIVRGTTATLFVPVPNQQAKSLKCIATFECVQEG